MCGPSDLAPEEEIMRVQRLLPWGYPRAYDPRTDSIVGSRWSVTEASAACVKIVPRPSSNILGWARNEMRMLARKSKSMRALHEASNLIRVPTPENLWEAGAYKQLATMQPIADEKLCQTSYWTCTCLEHKDRCAIWGTLKTHCDRPLRTDACTLGDTYTLATRRSWWSRFWSWVKRHLGPVGTVEV